MILLNMHISNDVTYFNNIHNLQLIIVEFVVKQSILIEFFSKAFLFIIKWIEKSYWIAVNLVLKSTLYSE